MAVPGDEREHVKECGRGKKDADVAETKVIVLVAVVVVELSRQKK